MYFVTMKWTIAWTAEHSAFQVGFFSIPTNNVLVVGIVPTDKTYQYFLWFEKWMYVVVSDRSFFRSVLVLNS